MLWTDWLPAADRDRYVRSRWIAIQIDRFLWSEKGEEEARFSPAGRELADSS